MIYLCPVKLKIFTLSYFTFSGINFPNLPHQFGRRWGFFMEYY